MRILITGVCGFAGSRIALGLQRRLADAEISGIDNLARNGSHTSLEPLAAAGVRVCHGDVRCASDFETIGDCDWVVDAAANPSVLAGVDGRTSSRQVVEHNLLGTLNVLEFCKRRRAGLLLLSTSRVFSVGALAALPLTVSGDAFAPAAEGEWPRGASPVGIAEGFSTAAPISLYGATKLGSEALALEYGDAFGLPVIVNRCGVLAGAGQFGTAEQGVFSFWIGSWAARRPLTYLGFDGTGHQVRDALHPDDLAELIARQIEVPDRAAGIWNVGGGLAGALSLAQLSRWCVARFGEHEIRTDGTPRRWDAPWIVMDHRRATEAFGWRPLRTLDALLGEIASHYADHSEWLDLSRADA